MGIAFGAKKNADVVYQMLGEALRFATDSATREKGDDLENSVEVARKYFALAFSRMTNTTFTGSSFVPLGSSPIKAAATLEEFRYVRSGEAVSEGRARQPGFMVTLNVPIFMGEVPFIGPQFLDVRMRCYHPAARMQLQ
jgi:hypothetical protein